MGNEHKPEVKKKITKKRQKKSTRRLYLDADLDDLSKKDDKLKEETPEEDDEPEKPPRPPKRFIYKSPMSNKRKIQIYGFLIITIIVILVMTIYAIPSWYAGISLQTQLYDTKAGLDFIEFYLLNFWSTSFIINKVGLIGALVGCVIMTLPPEKNLIQLIGTRFRFGRPSKRKVIIIWWTLGFLLFYFMGNMIDLFSNFSWAMYLIEEGSIDISLGLNVMQMVLTGTLEIGHAENVFVYNNVYLPIILFILGIIAFRIILNMVGVSYLKRNDFLTACNVCFLIVDFFAMYFFSIPMNSYDGLGLILLWVSPIAIICIFLFGLYFWYLFKQSGGDFIFPQTQYKRTGITAGVLIAIILIPAFFSIPIAVSINSDQQVWEEQRWDIQISKQIEWTRITAGLDLFEEKQIEDLISAKNISDLEVINVIRQYDKEAAIYGMNKYAPTPFESLGDSDIVFVNGTEYWVAPKTLKMSHLNSPQRKHQFDHIEGFLAIDTYTGDLIEESEFQGIFGVDGNYPIFFGEHESRSLDSSTISDDEGIFDLFAGTTNGAFDDALLMNTPWQDINYSTFNNLYNGTRDGILTGLEAFWYTSEMGFFAYATNASMPKEFLINRNIKTRVSAILLPGLRIDSDPYLVFDQDNGRMYYAVSISTDIPLNSFSQSGILRFMGVSLVDVLTGVLSFVENPAIVDKSIINDPTFNIWKIYLESYDWKSVNDDEYVNWLKDQLRYPEDLFEKQLEFQYYFHVQDQTGRRGGDQFHERPTNGDLFYVELDLGEGLEFVGVDLVQRTTGYSTGASTLAGMYVLRHGENFGKTIFYEAPTLTNKMISPSSAQEAYEAVAANEMALIPNKDFGNILLYPLNDSLYYFIPTYAEEGAFQVLKNIGFVEAFNISNVGYGDDAVAALTSLPFYVEYEPPPPPPPPPVGAGNVSMEYDIIQDFLYYSIIDINVGVQDNETYSQRHVIVNISVFMDETNITRFGTVVENSDFLWEFGMGTNYTVIDELLYPTEGYSLSVNLTASFGGFSSGFKIRVVLIVDGIVESYGIDEIITIYNEGYL